MAYHKLKNKSRSRRYRPNSRPKFRRKQSRRRSRTKSRRKQSRRRSRTKSIRKQSRRRSRTKSTRKQSRRRSKTKSTRKQSRRRSKKILKYNMKKKEILSPTEYFKIINNKIDGNITDIIMTPISYVRDLLFKNDTFKEDEYDMEYNDARQYIDSIYYYPDTYMKVIIEEHFKDDDYIQKVNKLNVPNNLKYKIIFKYVTKLIKIKHRTDYNNALNILSSYSEDYKKDLVEFCKKTGVYSAIEKNIYYKPEFKDRLITIATVENISNYKNKDIKNSKDLILKYSQDLHIKFKESMNYFNDRYKYTDYLSPQEYVNALIFKYKSNNTLKDIENDNNLPENVKTMLITIYVKELDSQPVKNTVNEVIKNAMDTLVGYTYFIPFYDNEYYEQQLNKNYKIALEYFSSKYGDGSGLHIKGLEKQLAVLGKIPAKNYKEYLLQLLELDIKNIADNEKYLKDINDSLEYFDNKYGNLREVRIKLLKERYKDEISTLNERDAIKLLEETDKTEYTYFKGIEDKIKNYYFRKTDMKTQEDLENYINKQKLFNKNDIKELSENGYLVGPNSIFRSYFKVKNFILDEDLYYKVLLDMVYKNDYNNRNMGYKLTKSLEYFRDKYKSEYENHINILLRRYKDELKYKTRQESIIFLEDIDKLETTYIDKIYKEGTDYYKKIFANDAQIDAYIKDKTLKDYKPIYDLYVAQGYYNIDVPYSYTLGLYTYPFKVKMFHLDENIKKRILRYDFSQKEIQDKKLNKTKETQDKKRKIKEAEDADTMNFLNKLNDEAESYFNLYGKSSDLTISVDKRKQDLRELYANRLELVNTFGIDFRDRSFWKYVDASSLIPTQWIPIGKLYQFRNLSNPDNYKYRDKIINYLLYCFEREEQFIDKKFKKAMLWFANTCLKDEISLSSFKFFLKNASDSEIIHKINTELSEPYKRIRELEDKYSKTLKRYYQTRYPDIFNQKCRIIEYSYISYLDIEKVGFDTNLFSFLRSWFNYNVYHRVGSWNDLFPSVLYAFMDNIYYFRSLKWLPFSLYSEDSRSPIKYGREIDNKILIDSFMKLDEIMKKINQRTLRKNEVLVKNYRDLLETIKREFVTILNEPLIVTLISNIEKVINNGSDHPQNNFAEILLKNIYEDIRQEFINIRRNGSISEKIHEINKSFTDLNELIDTLSEIQNLLINILEIKNELYVSITKTKVDKISEILTILTNIAGAILNFYKKSHVYYNQVEGLVEYRHRQRKLYMKSRRFETILSKLNDFYKDFKDKSFNYEKLKEIRTVMSQISDEFDADTSYYEDVDQTQFYDGPTSLRDSLVHQNNSPPGAREAQGSPPITGELERVNMNNSFSNSPRESLSNISERTSPQHTDTSRAGRGFLPHLVESFPS